jgi:pimeloyl-ACP methyl ester carboxylesterase
VLVHGWKGSHRLWDRTIVALQEHRRVVAFDLRGMGESDKPRCAYDFDELSDDLAFVLDALELDDVTLVGWSMGCTVALRHFERAAPRVGRLMLINGPLRLTRTHDFPHATARRRARHVSCADATGHASCRGRRARPGAGGLRAARPRTIP